MTTSIPDSIPFSSVIFGTRGRRDYSGIEELAESIAENGLIQPIVLEERYNEPTSESGDVEYYTYLLRAGGRRYHALAHLGTQTLYHSVSSEPSRPGFLIAGIAADEFRGLMIEISENHNRHAVPWQEDLPMIVKAYHLYVAQEFAAGHDTGRGGMGKLRRAFGQLSGMGMGDLDQGLVLMEELKRDPAFFADCGSIRTAYSKLLRRNAEFVAKIAAEKSFTKTPAFSACAPIVLTPEDNRQEEKPSGVVIPLSQSIHLGNGLSFMASCPDLIFDHIITDPDYALDKATLDARNWSPSTTDNGVVQSSVEDSIRDLQSFLIQAFRVTKGFCVFFYDLNHHEKLQRLAESIGWRVQRWPLTWIKTDYRANAAPNHNTAKNVEWAMMLRKPATTLAQASIYSTYSCPSGDVVKAFGHPYAKPLELWRWIYSLVAFNGQTVLDPFAGKGTAPCAAIEFGLRPVACEINPAHQGDLQLNMQAFYRKAIGDNISFS